MVVLSQHQRGSKILAPVDDPNFDRRLDAIVAGGHKHLKKLGANLFNDVFPEGLLAPTP